MNSTCFLEKKKTIAFLCNIQKLFESSLWVSRRSIDRPLYSGSCQFRWLLVKKPPVCHMFRLMLSYPEWQRPLSFWGSFWGPHFVPLVSSVWSWVGIRSSCLWLSAAFPHEAFRTGHSQQEMNIPRPEGFSGFPSFCMYIWVHMCACVQCLPSLDNLKKKTVVSMEETFKNPFSQL